MSSRHQRTRTGVSSERARGICRPATTRAQALRQAKSAAIINSRHQDTPAAPNPRRVRTGLARVGAPPLEPKRLEFSKPGVTKAMMARMQHVQKLKEAEEQKRRHEEAAIAGRPRRTAAPPGGDARLAREKSTLHVILQQKEKLKFLFPIIILLLYFLFYFFSLFPKLKILFYLFFLSCFFYLFYFQLN